MKSSIRNILLLMAFGTLSACSEQTVTVSYQEYPNAFRNPMKGFREFFAPGIDRVREEYPYPYGSLTKEYMQWNMIEDDANDGVDKIIAYVSRFFTLKIGDLIFTGTPVGEGPGKIDDHLQGYIGERKLLDFHVR